MAESDIIISKNILSYCRGRWVALLFYRLFRWILGGVFIYASFDKIVHPADFAVAVHNYQILPDALINPTALVLPWLELILGILLIIGVFWMPGTIALSNVLLMVFTGALLFNMYRGIDISCGCFSTSPDQETTDIWTIARDVSFMALSLYLLLYYYMFSASLRPTLKNARSVT